MPDIVEFQEDLVDMNHRPPLIFRAVVGQNSLDRDIMCLVMRQNHIAENIGGSLLTLARVEFGKGLAAP